MSLSLDTFNGLLVDFVEELGRTFPDEPSLVTAPGELKLLMAVDKRAALETFMDTLAPYTDLVTTKDSALFSRDIKLGGSIDMKKLWNSPSLSAASKDAIWQYIYSLFMVGMSLRHMSPEVLTNIEGIVKEVAADLSSGKPLDFSALLNKMTGLLPANADGSMPQIDTNAAMAILNNVLGSVMPGAGGASKSLR